MELDEPPGNPEGFKGCQVNLALPRDLCTKYIRTINKGKTSLSVLPLRSSVLLPSAPLFFLYLSKIGYQVNRSKVKKRKVGLYDSKLQIAGRRIRKTQSEHSKSCNDLIRSQTSLYLPTRLYITYCRSRLGHNGSGSPNQDRAAPTY